MLIITVLILQIVSGGEIDLFIPSFPDLQSAFNLSAFYVEILLSINIIAYCVASLFTGFLGDKYGAKTIMCLGLILFILGSIICITSTNYFYLLTGRILQGIGISGPAVLSLVTVAHIYPILRQQQLMGIINGIATFGMAFAPVIGSYVNLYFHWQGNFYLLLFLGIISLILVYFFIPKTPKKENINFSLTDYCDLLKSKKLFYYIFTISFSTLPYWLFISMAPILYMHDMNIPLIKFSMYQSILAGAFTLYSMVSSYLITKLGERKCMSLAIIFFISFIISCMTIIVFKSYNPLAITIIMQFLIAGMVFPSNIFYPLALGLQEDSKGRIAALATFCKWLMITLVLQIVSYFYNKNFTLIGIVMICSVIGSLWCYYKVCTLKTSIEAGPMS